MRYGFLGDIHSNLSALQVVLASLDEARVDRVISVGDVVGYGAAPSECISILRERDVLVVKGNHDAACTGELSDCMFNQHAKFAVRWTREVLGKEELHWLSSLPMTLDLEGCHVSHGTLDRPWDFGYIQTPSDADPSLDQMFERACFVGHTHVPVTMVRLRQDPLRTAYTRALEVDLSDVERALVNVGSVGQPRDDDARTGYAIYDTGEQSVTIRRLHYDIDTEAKRIRSAGLPSVLADRLYLGL